MVSRVFVIFGALTVPALAGARVTAQSADAAAAQHRVVPAVQAERSNDAIRLDGRLDDAAWQRAVPAILSLQQDPDEGQSASERTELRVVVGERTLYIGARMYDADPSAIVRRLGRRDERPSSDRFTLRLDPRHDHLTSFVFDVFPAGNKGDAAVGSDQQEDYSWDPVWDVATRIDSLGWTAELEIPLSQLRYDRNAPEWGIQVERFIQRKQELDVFSFVPNTESQGVNRYGHITGMGNLQAARRIELMPYTTARATYDHPPSGDPFRSGSEYNGAAGADLRIGITSDLTLDATFNPDFGQVEVDPAVVNLSAFEVTFPEQRPFFVQGADLFRFGQLRTFNAFGTPQTFFSRRIGRPPQGFVSNPAATFVDAPAQTTIAGALKLTGKLGGGWSLAMLDAVTPTERARYAVGADVSTGRTIIEPPTNYFASRLRREFNQGNTAVGALVTAVNRSLDDAPDLAAILRSDAYLAGIDINHAWSNRMWALDASYATTTLHGSAAAIARAQRSSARYFQRPDAEAINYDATRTVLTGHAAQLALTKTNGNWAGNIAYQEKTPGYETNDIGFTGTVGRRSVATDLHYYQPRPGPLFRNYTLGVLTGNDWNYDGDHTTNYVGSIQNFRFRNFWQLNTNVFHNFPSYDDQLTRGGPLARLPDRTNANVFLSTDSRGTLAASLNASLNTNTAGGFGRTIGINATLQPTASIRLTFGPSFSRFHNVSQFVTGVNDAAATAMYGRRSVFATVDQRELALDTRLDWTFNPLMSLQLFVQPLVSTGAYRDFKEFAQRGTFDFNVYGRAIGSATRDPATGATLIDPDGAGAAAAFAIPNQDFNFRSVRANAVFRWEYRPGSTLFLVWQQSREGSEAFGDFSLRRDLGAVFGAPATNVLAVKLTYWLGV